MEDDVLWVRMGDADDYESFEDLEQVAGRLAEAGIEEVEWHCQLGVHAPGFEGYNYISLYWGPDPGDGTAEATRGLTDDELTELNGLLAKRIAWATE